MTKRFSLTNFFLILLFLTSLLSSCDASAIRENRDNLIVLSWNVQNLFDEVSNGTEYYDYTPSSSWDSQSYQARLKKAAAVIETSQKPDVLVLCEVENQNVVEDLAKLLGKDYLWYATASQEGGAICVAILSRLPMLRARVHDVEGARPLLEVLVETPKGPVAVLGLHAKSRVEGFEETADLRLSLAETIESITFGLKREKPGTLILAAGDFNESHTDNSMMGTGNEAVLKLSGKRTTSNWFSFWLDSTNPPNKEGSYYYGGRWQCYDNILISSEAFDGAGWEYEEAGVISNPINTTADGFPLAWERRLLSGVSDHFPVWATFK